MKFGTEVHLDIFVSVFTRIIIIIITSHKLDNPQIQSLRLSGRELHIEKRGHTTISFDSASAEAGARTR